MLWLSGCQNRSFERASDGPTVYLDELSDAAKTEAREKIATALIRGTKEFYLAPGDEIELLYFISRVPSTGDYTIRIGDKLRIEFLGETDSGRTVEVRPDGKISLPLIGAAQAAGQSADGLARQLEQRYRGIVEGAKITVNVTESHSPLQEFLGAFGTSQGRSLTLKLLPDGTISVPALGTVPARGRTLKDLESEINAGYKALNLNVFVSVLPRSLQAGSAYILGEVGKPGRIDLDRPRTVLMALAQAGGVTISGAMNAVRLLYVGDDGVPRVRSINLRNVIDGLNLEQDMIVPNNAIIYVPTSALAQTGRFLDLVLRDVLRFTGFGIGGALLLNQNNNVQQIVPVQ